MALKKAGALPEAIDLIICATMTPDYITPSTAALIQKELALTRAAAFDMQAACTGFIYALAQAKAFIEAGIYKNILVVATEKMSAVIDYEDRNTCVLFGDGAAAAVVSDEGAGFLIPTVTLGADGNESHLILIPGGGSRLPATEETVKNRDHYVKMEGREVYKHAVRRMAAAAQTCLKAANKEEGDIAWLVPHQANKRIIESLANQFHIPEERIFMTLHKYGNTSGSSVGIALSELVEETEIKPDDTLLLVAFGAGLTWGAAILTYTEAS
jgi:3-oxoacyl-[acyl-carrier-protein] synthase-3